MHTKTAVVQLGAIKEYPLTWGNLARHRFGSIPPAQRNVVGSAQLSQLAWAAYGGVRLPFATWEDVLAVVCELSHADYAALDDAVAGVLPDPEPAPAKAYEKPEPEPSDAEKKSALTVNAPSPAVASG
jgi:hypothetical protein